MCLYTNINRESFNNFSLAELIQSCCAAFSLYPKSKKDGFSRHCERSEAIQLKSRRVEQSETPQDRTHNKLTPHPSSVLNYSGCQRFFYIFQAYSYH